MKSDLIYPFDNENYFIHDFDAAEELLIHLLTKTNVSNFLTPSPSIIMHPMERTPNNFSQVEYRALLELALGAGAREAFVYLGDELNKENINFKQLQEDFLSKIPKYE